MFADLDLVKRAELLTLFKPRSAVPGERLIRKGDAANEVFFISSGEVEVVGRQAPDHARTGRLLRRDGTPERRAAHRPTSPPSTTASS